MQETLSLTGKRWRVRDGGSLETLPFVTGTSLCASLMRERGLASAVAKLPEPPDLPRAIDRMRAALMRKEPVGIFGDYDCDGITAAAQIARYVRRHGCEPLVRLPHRVHDGYGLTERIAEEWICAGIRVLVTVDTGISAIAPIRTLQERGIDVIVVDHHHVREELPPAYALLHPALIPGCPLPHPSGAGMAYLFVAALEGGAWEDMHSDRALAMIGTVADLVELRGINRLIVQQGLQSLEDLRQGPLAALRDSVRGSVPLSSIDIAFRIAPRLNAAGRMDDPALALDAVLSGGAAIERLNQLNRARQEVTQTLVSRALASTKGSEDRVLMASASEEYPHGVIGLIAGALTEATGRPSIVATIDGAISTASLRSPSQYHVTNGLTRIGSLFESFGGHAQAAGCSFRAERWQEIVSALETDIAATVGTSDLMPGVLADARMDAGDLSFAVAEALEALHPFGQGNPEPRIMLSRVQATHLKCVGADASHLQGRFAGHKAIGFRLAHLYKKISAPVDVICRFGVDTWNGKRELQLFIEDLRLSAPVPATIASHF